MTVLGTDNRVVFSPSGAVDYPLGSGFLFFAETDLVVVRTDALGVETTLVLTTDYTVSGGDGNTGTVTTIPVYSDGELVIYRSMEIKQQYDAEVGDGFNTDTFEAQLDRTIMMVQEVDDRSRRSIRLGDGSTSSNDMICPDPEPLKLLRFTDDALGIELTDEQLVGADNQIGSVTNYTALSLLDSTGATPIFCKGRISVGDGGYGTFVWNSSDMSTEVTIDPMSFIYVPPASDLTGESGAWVRQFDSSIDVKWGGALGDLSADDYLPLQGAINLGTMLARPVYFSPGRYRSSAQLILPENPAIGNAYGLKMHGDNSTWASVSEIYAVHTDPAVLSLKGANGCDLSGLKLSGDPTTHPKCGLILGRDVNVDSCGWHNISKIWIDGYFSVAPIYSIASEENIWSDIFVQMTGGAAKYGFYTSTADNLGVDALPESSNIANSITKLNIWNTKNDPTAACIYMDGGEPMGSWSFYDCYLIPKSGSYITINNGDVDGKAMLGPISFHNCGGEIYAPVGPPYTDTPLYGINVTSVINIKLVGLNVTGSRFQLINEGGLRKVLNVGANVTLVQPNIVMQKLEDPSTSYTMIRNKIQGGVFEVSDSSKWIPLTFSGAWNNNFGAPYAPGAFCVDSTGTLRMRGNVGNGGGGVTQIAQLPPGYEPAYNMFFTTQDSGANAKILVYPTGQVWLNVGTGNDVDLTPVMFKLVD